MGLSAELLQGAIKYAQDHDVPMLESYPFDSAEGRISSSLAYVGTTKLFEAAGFRRVCETSGKTGGLARWLVRLDP